MAEHSRKAIVSETKLCLLLSGAEVWKGTGSWGESQKGVSTRPISAPSVLEHACCRDIYSPSASMLRADLCFPSQMWKGAWLRRATRRPTLTRTWVWEASAGCSVSGWQLREDRDTDVALAASAHIPLATRSSVTGPTKQGRLGWWCGWCPGKSGKGVGATSWC